MISPIESHSHLSARNISVRFGVISALDKVSLDICKGEIHAVIGEHGAGKSTFAKTISGFQSVDSGSIGIDTRQFANYSLSVAREYGIAIVHQFNPFFDDLTVGEYFYLDSAKKASFLFPKKRLFQQVDRILSDKGVDIRARSSIKNLRQSDRIFIDVCKKIREQPKVLILDEALEQVSTDKLGIIVNDIKKLKRQGSSILIITHRVDDILDIADRISVFKEGHIIYTEDVNNVDKFHLVQMAYTNFKENYTASPDFFKYIKYNEAILQKLPVNLLVVDNEFQVKIVNEQIESFFGMRPQELVESNLLDVFAEVPKLTDLIRKSIEENVAQAFFRVPIRFNRKNTICKANTLPIQDGNRCIGCIVLLEDITEHEKLREQLQLSENLSSIGLLAAGVAHEINNPLEIINYLVEEIINISSLPDVRNNADSIREEIGLISDITRNLLDFSGNTITNQHEDFDIDATLQELIKLIRLEAKKKQIDLTYENSLASTIMIGNRSELRQVFLNLLRNSFEAIDGSGSIRVSLSLSDTGRHIRIRFKDDGTGIADDDINSVFLPFYSTKTNQPGNSGLGLSLSYGIINNHGGRISVKKTDPGTEFLIELPYNAAIQL